MSYTVLPFQPTDIGEMVDIREFDKEAISGVPEFDERLEVYAKTGTAYTLRVDGQVVAVAGLIMHWRHVGELWAVTSSLVTKYPVAFHRAIKLGLEELIETHKLHRVECTVLIGHKVSVKWLNRLGFEIEGIKRKYDPNGNDYFMMARIIPPWDR